MTKSQLIERLTEKTSHISRKDMERIVNSIFKSITEALREGQRIELRGFGTFEIRFRNPRMGRNPKSGEKVSLGVRRIPFFKAGKEIKKLVNHQGGATLKGGGE